MAGQVEQIRELRFTRPVVPEPVSQARVAELLQGSLDHSFPEEMESRRGRAWAAIGVIPPGTDLRRAIVDAYGRPLVDAVDAVSAALSTADLARMNEQVSLERRRPADVARDWLEEHGLVG